MEHRFHRPHRRLAALACLGTLLLGPAPAVAEKPRSNPAQLAAGATHVVRGHVERVFTRVRRDAQWEHAEQVAEVKVHAVEKGEGIPLDRPLYARTWTKAWRGRGYPPPGTNGHAPTPPEGATVRLYLARNAYDGFGTERHDGGYDVLGVNGVQVLTPEEVREAEAGSTPVAPASFPTSWSGVWEGTLSIAKPGSVREETTMFLAIRPTDDPERFEFRFRYGREQPQRRYELVVRDAAQGRYAIDEKNGIQVPATYVDGELLSYFSLGESLVLARYRLVGDFLHFDLTQTGRTPDVSTGGGDVPEVGGHAVQVVQRAVLSR